MDRVSNDFSKDRQISHTLLVTALANFLKGVESFGLHNTEQYKSSISMPRVRLGIYWPSDFDDVGRDDGGKYRRLFFLCRLFGTLGLWRTYVMDNARERSKSGDGLLSINDRNADRQG